ncbi:hypothetical protein ACTXOR_00690 [Arthrobacter rhombi]|uniref:hypothetical protein n=1 Tax=Arthrobacter rhombi TaxID=71253 RepID=UPI003FD44F19
MDVDMKAMVLNVVIPDDLRWTDVPRGEEFELQRLTIRLLPDGGLAAKVYVKPVEGGRGAYVSFPVRDAPGIRELIDAAACRGGALWAQHRGWGA